MWKTDLISGKHASWVQTVVTLHPNYKYVFWTDGDCEILVWNAFPQFYEQYQSYDRGVARADACRILVLYVFGGIYVDLDTLFVKNLDPLLSQHKVCCQ